MTEKSPFKNPVFVTSMIIMAGVFIVIGSAIIGFDTVLLNMSRSAFARGLITYLFSVVTIGTAVVLIISLLTTEYDEGNKQRIDKGKDILSLLLGVFGTIVGFYFGTELGAGAPGTVDELSITSLLASEQQTASGDTINITAAVSGGNGPYEYVYTVGGGSPAGTAFVPQNGWIVQEIAVPVVQENSFVPVRISVEDTSGRAVTAQTTLAVTPE